MDKNDALMCAPADDVISENCKVVQNTQAMTTY